MGGDEFAEVERRLKVRGDDGIPLCLVHAHEQAVAGDTRVVDEDVYLPEGLEYAADHLLGGGIVGGICLYGKASATHVLYLVRHLVRTVFAVQIGECDVCSFGCHRQHNSATYAATSARDEGCFIG